jgi:hypothetical protein
VSEPAAIVFSPDLVADMLTPSPRPRLMGGALAKPETTRPEVEAPAPAKRGRAPKAKAPVAVLDAPAPSKREPKAKAPKAAKVAKVPAESAATSPAPKGTAKPRKK